MDESLRKRLQQLGVVKGARHLSPPAPRPPASALPPASPPGSLSTLVPHGRVVETEAGGYFLVERAYPLAQHHGNTVLGELSAWPPTGMEAYVGPRLAALTAADLIFLDTETTGLAGANTLAFMVGVAFFDGPALVTRQYFLREPGDEPAMLDALSALLAERGGLVTFNGATFDVPLLQGRYVMNRLLESWSDRPHLDLLLLARRLWRRRLGSVALGALEEALLGVARTQADVPGWLIPALYHDYLRTGDATELVRVFYHNEMDVLSMVTLMTQVMRLVSQPPAWPHGEDVCSLGGWQWRMGQMDSAESTLRLAAACDHDTLENWHASLLQLALLLKQQGRRAEAVLLWQQVAATSLQEVTAHIELAKYYEWQAGDLAAARAWTQAALRLTAQSPHAAALRQELTHRLLRLERKAASPATDAADAWETS